MILMSMILRLIAKERRQYNNRAIVCSPCLSTYRRGSVLVANVLHTHNHRWLSVHNQVFPGKIRLMFDRISSIVFVVQNLSVFFPYFHISFNNWKNKYILDHFLHGLSFGPDGRLCQLLWRQTFFHFEILFFYLIGENALFWPLIAFVWRQGRETIHLGGFEERSTKSSVNYRKYVNTYKINCAISISLEGFYSVLGNSRWKVKVFGFPFTVKLLLILF